MEDYSSVIWPSAILLAHHLLNGEPQCASLLELGAGLGLPSRVASLIWPECKIFLQDQNHLVSPFECITCPWGVADQQLPTTELIIAADCLYERTSFSPFMDTVASLLHSGATKLLMVYHDRNQRHWIGGEMERRGLKAKLIKCCSVEETMKLVHELPESLISGTPLKLDCDPYDQLYLLEIVVFNE